jgi:hypothetical protein
MMLMANPLSTRGYVRRLLRAGRRSWWRRGSVGVLCAVVVLVGSVLPAAATPGAALWTTRYDGPAGGQDSATAVGVSPDGSKVFATGSSVGTTTGNDYATVAYDGTTGAALWTQRYNGYNGGGSEPDDAYALTVSPDGSTVFVTGTSYGGPTTEYDWATIAYNATTGTQLWVARYNGPATYGDSANALRVSPDGSKLYVIGVTDHGYDLATVAYNAGTGAQLWSKTYKTGATTTSFAAALGVSPDGSTVFVTGHATFRPTRDDS